MGEMKEECRSKYEGTIRDFWKEQEDRNPDHAKIYNEGKLNNILDGGAHIELKAFKMETV